MPTSAAIAPTGVRVHVLSLGTYDSAYVAGVFTSREAAERAILDRVFAREDVDGAAIEEHNLIG